MGNFLKKSRNKSIIVFPCPHFGVYGFCLSASGSAQPPLTFFFFKYKGMSSAISFERSHLKEYNALFIS
jgi:hypothetical protein